VRRAEPGHGAPIGRYRPAASARGVTVALLLLAAALFAVFVWLAASSGPGSALAGWDGRVNDAFMAWRTPGRSRLFWLATLLGDTPVFAALSFSTVVLFAAWGRRGRAAAVAVALLIGWGISEGAKAIVGRVRPPAADGLIALPGSHSMPSGHALTTLVFLGVLVYAAFRWSGPRRSAPGRGGGAREMRAGGGRAGFAWGTLLVAVVAAGLIGVSRVYLGVHWLSDVLGGWCLAGAWLAVFLSVVRVWAWAGGGSSRAAVFLARHAPAGRTVRVAAVVFAVLLCAAALIATGMGDPLLAHL
jgi:membrane-associated phospholipid phosphatase